MLDMRFTSMPRKAKGAHEARTQGLRVLVGDRGREAGNLQATTSYENSSEAEGVCEGG